MAPSGKIVGLRKLLAERFPQPPFPAATRLATGLSFIDLVLNPPEELRKIPQTTWYRLQRLVKSSPTACLVLSRHGMVSSAQFKIVLENSWNLETFQEDEAISQLRIRVQRSHLLGQKNATAN